VDKCPEVSVNGPERPPEVKILVGQPEETYGQMSTGFRQWAGCFSL
jgi:hypothetical protein